MKIIFIFQIGVCVWPVLQTINFFFVPEHNRVIYVSCCSLIWTSFLAYMKSLEAKKLQKDLKSDNNLKHKDQKNITDQKEDKSKRVSIR